VGNPEYGTQYQEDGGWVDRYFFVFSVSLPILDKKKADPTRFWVSLQHLAMTDLCVYMGWHDKAHVGAHQVIACPPQRCEVLWIIGDPCREQACLFLASSPLSFSFFDIF